jgi:16S rRNA (guanine966-N2)-methyltransferase
MSARTRRPVSGKSPRRGGESGQCRIIGGTWRGRRIEFPAVEGLRPTPDRVRETLFNWLGPVLAGSRCLDLFAGSGALGLEAASRGAARVVMLDRDRRVVAALRETLARLGAEAPVELQQIDASSYLAGPAEPFDIVFVDPPYDSDLLRPVCRALEEGGWLRAGSLIYLEQPAGVGLAGLPEGWRSKRSKKTAQVGYHLIERE